MRPNVFSRGVAASVGPVVIPVSPVRRFRDLIIVLAFVLYLSCKSNLPAQDHVVLQVEGQSSRMVVPCQIVDYTGEKITVQLKSGAGPKTYPAEQVIEVRTG